MMTEPVQENPYQVYFDYDQSTVDICEDLRIANSDDCYYSRHEGDSPRYEEQTITVCIPDRTLERRYDFTIKMDRLTSSRIGTPQLKVLQVIPDYTPHITTIKTYTGKHAAALYDIVIQENLPSADQSNAGNLDELTGPDDFSTDNALDE